MSTLYSYQSITDSFPSDMPKYFRCQLSFNTQSSSLLKDIIICGGIPQKTRSPIHKDSENFAYTCIIGRSSKQENYFQILIRSQHKVIYMTIMKHNPNYLRSKCVSISTIFLFYQYFIMFLIRTVICVLPFKNHNQDRYLFSNVKTNVQSTDPN